MQGRSWTLARLRIRPFARWALALLAPRNRLLWNAVEDELAGIIGVLHGRIVALDACRIEIVSGLA
jgi:hypothetical protein